MAEQVSRFKHIRVRVSNRDDAFGMAIAVEVALKSNGATTEELNAFRKESFGSVDMMETARNWVDAF